MGKTMPPWFSKAMADGGAVKREDGGSIKKTDEKKDHFTAKHALENIASGGTKMIIGDIVREVAKPAGSGRGGLLSRAARGVGRGMQVLGGAQMGVGAAEGAVTARRALAGKKDDDKPSEADRKSGGRVSRKDGGKNWIAGATQNKGSLHKALKVPLGEKIPVKKLDKAAHSDNPTMRRRANLAQTLKKLGK